MLTDERGVVRCNNKATKELWSYQTGFIYQMHHLMAVQLDLEPKRFSKDKPISAAENKKKSSQKEPA